MRRFVIMAAAILIASLAVPPAYALSISALSDLLGWIVVPLDAPSNPNATCNASYSFGPPTNGLPGTPGWNPLYYDSFDNPYDGTSTLVNIYVDYYQPDSSFTGARPALVMIHGGGWQQGCRAEVNEEAVAGAQKGYAVFAIDYRLSCRYSQVSDQNIQRYCGQYGYQTQPQDVKDAIHWVRQTADSTIKMFRPNGSDLSFNSKVAVLGFSAGGNLAYMAQATGTSGDTMPDVVGGWSGPTEMGLLVDGNYAWEESYDFVQGGDGTRGARERYMTPAQACSSTSHSCPPEWYSASPYSVVGTFASPSLITPAFIANASYEKIGIAEATDYRDRLGSLGIRRKYCRIGTGKKDPDASHLHATGFFGPENKCSNQSGSVSVWEDTIAFFNQYTLNS
jgi:acetyl esterase/lipase